MNRNRFIGREREIATLRAILQDTPLVTLAGSAGSGKTRLALELGRSAEGKFPDGVWFVDLSTVADRGLVADAIANALGIRGSGRAHPTDRIVSSIGDQRLLLILDNCEHLLPGVATIAAELTERLSSLNIVTTSRAALNIPGEHLFPVAPLPVHAAVQLFCDRADQQRPPAASDEQDQTIAALCKRLDCLPLAIELAAARSHILTPAQMIARLDDRFALLTSRNTVSRQAALKTALEWSHDLLADSDRAIFRRLGIFSGDFDLDTAEAVCGDGPSERWQVLEAIERLVHHSMMTVAPITAPGPIICYAMLESIREYARDRLDDAGERSLIAERHANHFLKVARESSTLLNGPRHLSGMAALDHANDDIIAAFLWAIRSEKSTLAMQIAAAMWPAWQARGQFLEGARRLDDALAIDGDVDPIARAETLTGAALLNVRLGDHRKANARAKRAFDAWRALNRRDGEARALDLQGLVALRSGELNEAERCHHRALGLWREIDDKAGLAKSLTMLGQLANTRGNTTDAERLYTEAWSIARQSGDIEAESALLVDLGDVAARTGRFRQSVAFYEQALALNEMLDNPDRSAAIISNLAEVRVSTGETGRAVLEASEGVVRYRKLGNRAHLADALYILGIAQQASTRDAEALDAFRESLGIYVELGNEVYAAHTIEVIAEIATRHNAPVEAARLFGGAAALRARVQVAPYALFDHAGALNALERQIGGDRLASEMTVGGSIDFVRLVLLAMTIQADVGRMGAKRPAAIEKNGAALTERQTEVLRLVATGLSNHEIAEALRISERTVERHLSAIYLALEVDRRSSAVAYAIAHGIHQWSEP